jgi:hypothetical protein
MFKTTEMRQPLYILSSFFFCLFSGSILSLLFSFFSLFFVSVFLRNRRRKTRKRRWLGLWRDQTGDGGGVLGFEWWKNEGWWKKTQCNQQQMTRKHTNSTMQIIERKCEAHKGAGTRSNLNFYVVLWIVGEKKKLDKPTNQPGILIPLDIAEVPDLSMSGDNFDLAEDDPCDPTTTSKSEALMQSLNQLPMVTDLADARSAWSRRSFPARNRRTNKKKMRAI